MKLFAIIIMLVALYLLYRIAYPERQEVKKGGWIPFKMRDVSSKKTGDLSPKKKVDISEVVVKSRFVRPVHGQPQTTRPDSLETDSQQEKPDNFAAVNKKREAAIPPGKLDKVFTEEPDPEEEPDPKDLDIEPDENETDTAVDGGVESEVDSEEEAEELRQALGGETPQAGGWSIEEMAAVVEATQKPTDSKAAILYNAEKTDLFEQLISGDKGKAVQIAAIIERHVRGLLPEETNNDVDNKGGFEDFDVTDFLS